MKKTLKEIFEKDIHFDETILSAFEKGKLILFIEQKVEMRKLQSFTFLNSLWMTQDDYCMNKMSSKAMSRRNIVIGKSVLCGYAFIQKRV